MGQFRRWFAVGLGAALLALGACSRGAEDVELPTGDAPTSDAVVEVETHPGTADDDFVGARNDVSGLACAQDGDRWAVSGAVSNSSEGTADYRIYVSFLDGDRDTRGLLQVSVDGVAPGESRPWEGALEVEGADLDCVLRVERASQG